MWERINLRTRVYLILAALMGITLSGGLVTVWHTYRIEKLFGSIIDQDLAMYQNAEQMEIALINQKGFVTYYFLDNDPTWLRRLGEFREIFRQKLEIARSISDKEQTDAIDRLEIEYNTYIKGKDRVITYYQNGNRFEGAALHQEVRKAFEKTIAMFEEYKNVHIKRIERIRESSKNQALQLRVIAGIGMFSVFSLGLMLTFVLMNHILEPIRKLALEANRENPDVQSKNEIKALSKSVRGLIENVDQTQFELVKSRENLLQAEKMALVGKLAASMAHSIRNPFTSIKMRLFSLNRTLNLSLTQKEDFEVISSEIRHLDNIVQNFLEFSRPPKLKMQDISLSGVVDMTLQLLEHRLKSYDVNVKLFRKKPLPLIHGDPEQLKEVLVNLIINACEAMENGGEISIYEEETIIHPQKHIVIIRLTDNGPGIPESIQNKIFDPFFTTKDHGTGLGLSIAFRIVAEHQGSLDMVSMEGEGTSFVLSLPIKDIEHE